MCAPTPDCVPPRLALGASSQEPLEAGAVDTLIFRRRKQRFRVGCFAQAHARQGQHSCPAHLTLKPVLLPLPGPQPPHLGVGQARLLQAPPVSPAAGTGCGRGQSSGGPRADGEAAGAWPQPLAPPSPPSTAPAGSVLGSVLKHPWARVNGSWSTLEVVSCRPHGHENLKP